MAEPAEKKAGKTQIFEDVHRGANEGGFTWDLGAFQKICLNWVANATAGRVGKEGERCRRTAAEM